MMRTARSGRPGELWASVPHIFRCPENVHGYGKTTLRCVYTEFRIMLGMRSRHVGRIEHMRKEL